jgi:YD repeat-containing protein
MDGTEIHYNHDALGQITRTSYPDSQTRYAFDKDGRLIQTKEDGGTAVQYQYSLNGTPKQVTYGDRRKQTFELDQYSRVTSETDAYGVVQEITYNEFGSVSRQSCGSDTVTYIYSSINHTEGQALRTKLTGEQHAHHTELTHDGFDRVRRTRV